MFTFDYRKLETTEGNALVYVTGYLLKKALIQHSCDVCEKYKNLNDLEEQESHFFSMKAYDSQNTTFWGLTMPPKTMVEYVTALETKFVDKFNNFAYEPGVGAKLKNIFSDIPFPHPCRHFPVSYFIALYTRVRIYFTLKFANRDIKSRKTKPNQRLQILNNL